jgi:hypothetical protein
LIYFLLSISFFKMRRLQGLSPSGSPSQSASTTTTASNSQTLKSPTYTPIGTFTVFPSYTLHEVSPILDGARYSLVGWVNGPDFK